MSFWRGHRYAASLLFVFCAASLTAAARAQVTSSSSTAPQQQSASASAPLPGETPGYGAPLKYPRDLALSAFDQVTSFTNGNFVRVDTTGSVGGLLSYRQAYRRWFGYEANYGYTRYTDSYFFGQTRIAHNTQEFSLAYLLQGPDLQGFRPFFTIGGGALVFSPTGSATGSYGADAKRLFVYGIGIQHPLFSDRLGLRVQFRALKYGAPAFGQLELDTHRGRTSDEPSIGVTYRF